jgi:hypothetical protein
MEDAVTLICMPADSPWTVPGSTFTRVCVKCFRRVMVAPTSVSISKEFRKVTILCGYCFLKEPIDPDTEYRGPTQAQLMELRTAIPNLWRAQN